MRNEVFRPRRRWLNGNYIGMSEEILDIDWDKLFFGKDIDSCYLIFVDKFHQLCEKFVPESKQSGRTGAPWFTNEIKSIIKQKHKLWYRVKSSKSSLIKEEYIRVCKELKQKIRSSKNNYELELANRSKRDPKLVYKYVKSQQNVNEQVRALVDKDGHLVTDRKIQAEILNDQYKSVFVVEPEDVDLPVFISKLTNCLGVENLLSCLTEDAIERKLLSLNSHKACGADEVNSHVLKACASAFSKPLKIIFRKSLIEGYVP